MGERVPMREQGSVLMLMPAAVLVLIVLGALSVDFGHVYAAERELSGAAAAAANDAATRAIDLDHYYATGEVRLLEDRAVAVARSSVAAMGLERLDARVLSVVISPSGDAVTVRVAGRVRYLFAKAVPGGPDSIGLDASAEASAEELPG